MRGKLRVINAPLALPVRHTTRLPRLSSCNAHPFLIRSFSLSSFFSVHALASIFASSLRLSTVTVTIATDQPRNSLPSHSRSSPSSHALSISSRKTSSVSLVFLSRRPDDRRQSSSRATRALEASSTTRHKSSRSPLKGGRRCLQRTAPFKDCLSLRRRVAVTRQQESSRSCEEEVSLNEREREGKGRRRHTSHTKTAYNHMTIRVEGSLLNDNRR